MTETPGATHDAVDEAATGGIAEPHPSKTTSARAYDRAGRKPPINTPWIVCGTTLGPAVRATPSASPVPLLPLATQEPGTYDHHTRPGAAGGRSSRKGQTGWTAHRRSKSTHGPTEDGKPRKI